MRRVVYVFGADFDKALCTGLKQIQAGVLFFPATPPPSETHPALAIAICEARDDSLQTFHVWAKQAAAPALRVEVRNDAALIGPLSLPEQPGCGYCAYARLVGASAGGQSPPPVDSGSNFVEAFAPILAEQVRAILDEGPEQSELLNHILICDAKTLDQSLHKVIPLARCLVCGGAAAFRAHLQESERIELSPEQTPEAVLTALQGWVDQRTGVISNLFLEPPTDREVALPLTAIAGPPHVLEEDGTLRRLPVGWGKGLTVSGAVLSAVGEAIERYSASLPDPERLVWAKPGDLDEFLDPRPCALYTEAQYESDGFPYVRFDAEIEHPWVQGKWMHDGKPVFVAAIDAFLLIKIRQEQLFSQGTSNGLAAATDFEEAALRATLELVERDAVMTAWFTATPGRRIKLDDTLDPQLAMVLDGIERLHASVEIYTLPTSVCGTTILCLALGDGDTYPGITFGLGCDLDPDLALRQAILELGQTGPYLRRMMRTNRLVPAVNLNAVREMLDHAAYYFPRDRAAAFKPLRGTDAPLRLRELPRGSKRSLASCSLELQNAGVRVALVDVTAADVETSPFRVVRAMSPDLQPISYGYGLDRRPVERVSRMKLADEIPPISPLW